MEKNLWPFIVGPFLGCSPSSFVHALKIHLYSCENVAYPFLDLLMNNDIRIFSTEPPRVWEVEQSCVLWPDPPHHWDQETARMGEAIRMIT